jgi:hypothetical protein
MLSSIFVFIEEYEGLNWKAYLEIVDLILNHMNLINEYYD